MAGVVDVGHVVEPERGFDERREGLDVGAHDEHVARLEGGVVGEEADDDLAQHVDLSGGTVAGVHLHGPVEWVEGADVVGRAVAVGGEVGLELTEQGRGALRSGQMDRGRLAGQREEAAFELGDVSCARGEEGVAGVGGVDGVATGRLSRGVGGGGGHVVPSAA